MGWLKRRATRLRRGARVASEKRTVDDAVTRHLSEFSTTRRGVEAYVEPQTNVTNVTLLLVAYDGEWTRREVPSADWANSFSESLGLPRYDAGVVGYPQRMRDFNTRKRRGP